MRVISSLLLMALLVATSQTFAFTSPSDPMTRRPVWTATTPSELHPPTPPVKPPQQRPMITQVLMRDPLIEAQVLTGLAHVALDSAGVSSHINNRPSHELLRLVAVAGRIFDWPPINTNEVMMQVLLICVALKELVLSNNDTNGDYEYDDLLESHDNDCLHP